MNDLYFLIDSKSIKSKPSYVKKNVKNNFTKEEEVLKKVEKFDQIFSVLSHFL